MLSDWKFPRPVCLLVAVLLVSLHAVPAGAQIVNRLKVDDAVFQRYAYGRMQMYNPANLPLADSIYQAGVQRESFRYKCLGLSLEFPVRFAQGDYARMDECIAEIKELVKGHADARPFYFAVIHEYCQYLIHTGRASDAMLEARDMERRAAKLKMPAGIMYSHRIVGLIQSYRTNSWLAIRNFEEAALYCKEAKAEQELPNLYILIAQEYVKMGEFEKAEEYCVKAEQYQDFFPSICIKARMTRAYLYNAEKDWERFWTTYEALESDPLYAVQTDSDSRYEMDVAWLRSKGFFEQALSKADSLGTARDRHALKHGIYAELGNFNNAYGELSSLMAEKDSIYIKVQNEDMAILDAEMNNAKLRAEAERLKHQNQMTILLGFLVMFGIAFFAILLSQWQLRQNLDEMRRRNAEVIRARRAFQKAMDAKEAENANKIKILQNRTTNPMIDYEAFLNS